MARSDEDETLEALVAMIDGLMAKGDGHVNVTADAAAGEVGELNVLTVRSSDCGTGACCQPNEEAPDDDDR